MKFILKIRKFMQGRYGADELYRFCFLLYFICILINMFLNSLLLLIIEFVLILVIFYRFLSKNIIKRTRENNAFLKLASYIKLPFYTFRRYISSYKTAVYKKCRHCKTTLKLPLPTSRGIKHVICPNCKKRISFVVLRKQKIEIIRNS